MRKKRFSPSWRSISTAWRVRPAVWLLMLLAAGSTALAMPLMSNLAASPVSTTVQPVVQAAPVRPKTPTKTDVPAASPTITVARATPTVPTCTPSSFTAPSSLILDGAQPGLHVQYDSPLQYQIYGNTAAQLRAQIQHCAPGAAQNGGAEFTGDTGYTLSWQYSTIAGDTCRLTDVKIGVHIVTALPLWQPTPAATTGLNGRWQQFMAGLTTHEAGHAAIDKLYSAQLLSDLNSLPAMDCGEVAATVRGVVNTEVAALNRANDAYDASTNHGATQGAILPTY